MDPLFAAGMMAAAYDLGLSHGRPQSPQQGSPSILQMLFGAPSASTMGLLGFAAGHHGADDVSEHNRSLVAALQQMASLRSQEKSEGLLREQQLRDALVQAEQRRQMLEVARWAHLAAQRGSPQHYI